MPGAYAHITAVNLAKESGRLDRLEGFPDAAKSAIHRWFRFCELGCVSPDYPYLAVFDTDQNAWADRMHYETTGDPLKAGVREVSAMSGYAQQKAFAWLCGYAAHIATDVTVHPVIELKVGPYAQNKTAHRVCEMNQDAYIFQRLNLGSLGLSEHLKSGIGACSASASGEAIDPVIDGVWNAMLRTCYGAPFVHAAPDIGKWHRGFRMMVDEIGEEGGHLVPLARHVAVNCGLSYPDPADVDDRYITGLETPEGVRNYDEIFDRAVTNITALWRLVARAVFEKDDAYESAIGNWNLDTGRDARDKLVFWTAAV